MEKEKSFWTPVKPNKKSMYLNSSRPMKMKPVKLFGYEVNPKLRPNFLMKPRTPVSPVNLGKYPVRTKSEMRLIDKKPFGDYDKDGVPNYLDCRPKNKRKKDKLRIVEVPATVLGYSTAGQYSGIHNVPEEYKRYSERLPQVKESIKKARQARTKLSVSSNYQAYNLTPQRRAELLTETAELVGGRYDVEKMLAPIKFSLDPTYREMYERKRGLFAHMPDNYAEREYPGIKILTEKEIHTRLGDVENLLARRAKSDIEMNKGSAKMYTKNLAELKAGYTKQELEGKKKIPTETHVVINKTHYDKYKDMDVSGNSDWYKRKHKEYIEQLGKEKKQTIHHELLHHNYGKLKGDKMDVIDRMNEESDFPAVEQYIYSVKNLGKNPEKKKVELNSEITTVKTSYLPFKRSEELAVRLAAAHPEIIYKEDTGVKVIEDVKKANRGHRVYGNTIYTKEEYSKTPEKPEVLQVEDIERFGKTSPEDVKIIEERIESKPISYKDLPKIYFNKVPKSRPTKLISMEANPEKEPRGPKTFTGFDKPKKVKEASYTFTPSTFNDVTSHLHDIDEQETRKQLEKIDKESTEKEFEGKSAQEIVDVTPAEDDEIDYDNWEDNEDSGWDIEIKEEMEKEAEEKVRDDTPYEGSAQELIDISDED